VQRLRFLFLLLSSFLLNSLQAQDTCGLRISLLTCAPGAELYSIFGHTAIRVQDDAGNDLVYNYGTFEFGDDFYIQFIRGKLPYFLSVESFDEFLAQYRYESRSVWEQQVVLDCPRKAALLEALNTNAQPQNRQYRYDFLFDNCTTRAGKMILGAAPQPATTTRIIPADPKSAPTFRNLIHEYLDRGHQPWSKLGIDLLLGAKLDRRVSNEEAQFLPEKLMKAMDGAQAAGRLVVAPATTLFNAPPQTGSATLSPLLVFSALTVLLLVLSFVPARAAQRVVRVFDFVLFFLAGMVGILLLVMWFGTDHTVCANNWNLLWALPTHIVVAPFLYRDRRWVQWYLLVTIVIQSLLLLGWIFLPQQLNIGFLPLVLLLLLRAWLIILKPHYNAPAAAPEQETALPR
jgi:hypothetical protein